MMKILLRFSTLAILFAFISLPQIARADITINSEEELRAFASSVNSVTTYDGYNGQNVYLTCDITLTSDWTPIGTSANPFKGHFEGWGHKISNMNITSGHHVGLFGYVSGGSIRDVAVISGSISTSGDYVGAICGYMASSGEISSCYSTINVTGNQYVGGICGYFNGNKIEDCYTSGLIKSTATTGGAFVGGIAGQVYRGDVQHCYVSGKIDYYSSANGYYGSIVGDVKKANESYIHITHCVYKTDANNPEYTPKAIGCSPEESMTDGNNLAANETVMKTAETWTIYLNYLSYNIAWKIENGSYPQLYSFIKNEPITFNFTSEKKWLTIVPNGNYAVPAEMKAYIVTDVSGNTVTLRSVSTLNEGRAAIVWSEAGTSVTVNSTNEALSDYGDYHWLKGSHVSPTTLKGNGNEYILSGGTFYKSKSGTLARNKAYLDATGVASSPSSMQVIIEDDDATAVRFESSSVQDSKDYYDLLGHKAKHLQKGNIYIHNGRKIIAQ